MKKERYIAYVGTYTHGSSLGIHIYDMDVENGTMEERKVVAVNNPSHITKSRNGKYLYSIADEGVKVLEIEPDGDLTPINQIDIDGMRGCYLSTDKKGKFLFVAGYHDGKVTVVHTHKDGRLGSVLDGVFHKGLGSIAERTFRPHVTCVLPTPDNKYLCAVDNGIDQVKIYTVDNPTGKLNLVDIIRCELESAPRLLKFSSDGKFAYLICELTKQIRVYTYNGEGMTPHFELIQTVRTYTSKDGDFNAASGMKFSADGEHLICSTAGENTAGLFKVNKKTGELKEICILPISGIYPKDVDFFPDGRHLISLSHESNEIRIFEINYEKKYFIQKGRPIKVETPNCILISKIEE